MTKIQHFVSVGAGIAGLAAAIALAKAGHRVTVLEQAAEIEGIGAGIQIGPNACHALQLLGVWDALEPKIVAPDQIVIRDAKTASSLKRIGLGMSFERRFGAPYRVSHRADLITALLQIATDLPAITIRTDCRVEDYSTAAGTPSVQLAGLPAVEADVVIGADGIRSSIRQSLLADGAPHYAGHVIYRALLPIDQVPQSIDRQTVNLWLYPGGHVVHYPVSGGRQFNVVAARDGNVRDEDWHTFASPGEVMECFDGAVMPLRDLLSKPTAWHRWSAADRAPAQKWGAGPVTMIGDAAHPSLPYLAQGAAMALEDAVVLGLCCNRTGDAGAALRNYESMRQSRTARVAAKSRRMGQIYHMRSGPAAIRNLVITAMPASLNLSNLSWLYHWRPQQG